MRTEKNFSELTTSVSMRDNVHVVTVHLRGERRYDIGCVASSGVGFPIATTAIAPRRGTAAADVAARMATAAPIIAATTVAPAPAANISATRAAKHGAT